MDYFFVFLFTLVGFGIAAVGLIAAHFLAPVRPGGIKNEPYECGEPTIGNSWVQFNVGYYLFALLFLVFDVEAAFLFPWAVVFRDVGLIGLIEVGIFVLILIVGLLYAWKKGVLEWV